jgi:hypothetical protein
MPNYDDIFGAAGRGDSQPGDFPVIDSAFDGSSIRGMQLKIRRPIRGPGGHNLNLSSGTLHNISIRPLVPQHQLVMWIRGLSIGCRFCKQFCHRDLLKDVYTQNL